MTNGKMIIDTHVHCWDLSRANYPWLQGDKSILNRTWTIGELEAERIKAGVTTGVLVQAAGNVEDTDLMLETARNTSWIAGVVAWLPLEDPAATKKILQEKYLGEKYFKGVRHQVHDEKDARWLLQPAVVDSLKILAEYDIPYDVVGILPAHLRTVLELTAKIPGLRMVLDHLNQPPIATKERFGEWGQLIKEVAGHKNIYAKISGLGTASGNFNNRTADDIKPYIEFALEHFGTDRCFCGGDWPVSVLANSYSEIWKIYDEIISGLVTKEEVNKIFSSNAIRFYKLEIS
jgi:L-fuconolactonase